MSASDIKKKEGFQGQKAVVIPKKVLTSNCLNNAIIAGLYITHMGYYPKARFHYRKRLHGAEQHILIYCIEGKGSVTINKNQYDIEPGDFFIVPKQTEHHYAANEKHPWTIYWVHFTGGNSDAIVAYTLDQLDSHKSFLHYDERSTALFNTIYNQLERGYGIDNLVYANMCFCHYLSFFMHPEKANPVKASVEMGFVNIVIDFMKKNIASMCTLQQMADEASMSASHFSFLFKERTGYPPIEYFNHLKVQQACQYLMFTHLRIKEIASKLGMDDPYYFSRFFTRQMGMSPNTYRERRNQ